MEPGFYIILNHDQLPSSLDNLRFFPCRSLNFIWESIHMLWWPTTVTAKINTPRQKKITHGKRKLPTKKRKDSRQKEKPRGKKKNLAAKRKRLAAKRKDSRKKEKLSRGKRKKGMGVGRVFRSTPWEKMAVKRGVIGLQDSYPMFSLAVLPIYLLVHL